MDRSELSEIRARLRADADTGGRRPRRPLLAPLRALLGPPAPLTSNRPAGPQPRRVGLNSTVIHDDGAELDRGLPLEVTGRQAFGQRTEPATLPLLQLTGPDEPIETEEAPRWGSMLAAARPAAFVAEIPYLPEDFSDPAEGETERLYAAAGLVHLDPERPIPRREVVETPPVVLTPEQELLMHLERVFLAEFATVEAKRL